MANKPRIIAQDRLLSRGDVVVAMQDHHNIVAGGVTVVLRVLRSRNKNDDGVQILGDESELYPLSLFKGLFRMLPSTEWAPFADEDGSVHKALLDQFDGISPRLVTTLQRAMLAARETLMPSAALITAGHGAAEQKK